MHISVFLGAPGSGKGTQAKQLTENHNYKHFSTGDMLRASVMQGAELGMRAKSYIDQGQLVPDSLMIQLIEEALAPLGADENVILDGFPRTVPQAEALDSNDKTQVNLAVFFEVPSERLIDRLTSRRNCANCGAIYNVAFLPPKEENKCDKCGGKLTQRSDDTYTVVVKRLEVFEKQNAGLINYFTSNNKLKEINADQSVSSIQSDLLHLLETWYS